MPRGSSRALAIPIPGPGRKSLYCEEYADQVRKLCLLGAIDAEIAEFFGVCEATINNWKNEHPAFLEAIRAGKIQADANVADSLYRRATGDFIQLEKLVKNSGGGFEAIRYKQFLPGDPQAALNWLKNRRCGDWRDKHDVEHGLTSELAEILKRIDGRTRSVRPDVITVEITD